MPSVCGRMPPWTGTLNPKPASNARGKKKPGRGSSGGRVFAGGPREAFTTQTNSPNALLWISVLMPNERCGVGVPGLTLS